MRHTEVNLTDVRRVLRNYCENPPEEQLAREVIECYSELSPEAQDNISIVVLNMIMVMRVGFGPVNALELIGALMKKGYL